MDSMPSSVDLRRKDFSSWTERILRKAHAQQDFSDVTLVSADDEVVPAHKIILSSSSSFFEKLFTKHNHPNPLIFLNGVSGTVLGQILDFIYLGETRVDVANLEEFMQTGKDLKIMGIEEDSSKYTSETQAEAKAEIDFRTVDTEFTGFPDDTSNVQEDRFEEDQVIWNPECRTETTVDQVEEMETKIAETPKTINKLEYIVQKQIETKSKSKPQGPPQKEKNLFCNLCDYKIHRNNLLRDHMNSKHDAEKFCCQSPGCGKVYSSRNNLRNHMKSNHDCAYCEHIAESNSDLKLHKRIKHGIN
jgi:hypothetical protein